MNKRMKLYTMILCCIVMLHILAGSGQTVAAVSSAATTKLKEAKALVTSTLLMQKTSKTRVAAAKIRESDVALWILTATNYELTAKLFREKLMAVTLKTTSKAAVSSVKNARVYAENEAKAVTAAYQAALKAKAAADKFAAAKTKSAISTTSKAALSAIKATTTAITKAKTAAIAAAKFSGSADAAWKKAKTAANKVNADVIAKQAAAKEAADKAAADKAAADKAAADKAAADKAAADKAAADQAAADKAAADKAAADKAAADKAAADKAAADKAAADKATADKAAADKAAADKAIADKAAADKAAADKAAADKAAADKAAQTKVTNITITPAGNITIVSVGSTLQITAAATPVEAGDKRITWMVAPGTGTAAINEQTGLLTGSTVGTVTVIALNTASGKMATTQITVVQLATSITGYTLAPGNSLNSTKVTYTPVSGNTLRYMKQTTTFPNQIVGNSVGAITLPYTSGSDIPNAAVNEHLGIYEVDASNRIVRFADILLTADKVASYAPNITGYSVEAGTVVGSTKVTYTAPAGNYLKYVIQAGAFTPPVVGAYAGSIGAYYTSGNNITGVLMGQHIGIYEITSANTVLRFIDIATTSNTIGTLPPLITGHVVAAGSLAGSTKITYTPTAGNTLKIIKQTTAFTAPLLGTSASTLGVVYVSGDNILSVATAQHIGLIEINYAAQVVKFIDITLVAANIALAASTPVITNYSVEPGTVLGSTRIHYTPTGGNVMKYVKSATLLPTPPVGSSMGIAGTLYTSGTNITSLIAGQHIGLYEIDAANQVVKFVDITLGVGNITSTGPAPAITGHVVEPGSVFGATKITYAIIAGNKLAIQLKTDGNPVATPLMGANVSTISTIYTSGNDIASVVPGNHIGLYELDASNYVVKFIDITLGAGNILTPGIAPPITGYVVGQGTVSSSTKITYTPTGTNTLRYSMQAAASPTPNVATTVPGTALLYTSGDNILTAGAGKHVSLYEIDSQNKVVRFVDITLSAGNIAASTTAPTISITSITKGTIVGATAIGYTPAAEFTLRYVKQSQAFITPLEYEDASAIGSAYTSGNNITGAISGEHVGLYVIDAQGLVRGFVDITLTGADIADPAPLITTYTVVPGAVYQTTKISYAYPASNEVRFVKQSGAFEVPVNNSQPTPMGGLFVSGTDSGVVSVGDHIGLYEFDSGGHVIGFADITLVASNVAAPQFMGCVPNPGNTTKTTIITCTVGSGNSIKYQIQLAGLGAISIPAVGTDVSLYDNYISGASIGPVVVGDHIGLYEVTATGKVVSFTDITLISSNIRP